MHLLAGLESDLVAQEVEADLVGGSVGDVAAVGGVPLRRAHGLLHASHREAERLVDRAHPARIAAGEVVVDGHRVDAGARAGVPGDGGRAGQRLAFAGLHFDDFAACQRQRALQLHVEHLEM